MSLHYKCKQYTLSFHSSLYTNSQGFNTALQILWLYLHVFQVFQWLSLTFPGLSAAIFQLPILSLNLQESLKGLTKNYAMISFLFLKDHPGYCMEVVSKVWQDCRHGDMSGKCNDKEKWGFEWRQCQGIQRENKLKT